MVKGRRRSGLVVGGRGRGGRGRRGGSGEKEERVRWR